MEFAITVLESKKRSMWERIKAMRRMRRMALRVDPSQSLTPPPTSKFKESFRKHRQLCRAIKVLKSQE
jgi:hypothetical protein